MQPHSEVRAGQQAIEALRLQMTQLRAQLAEVNRQNTQLRSQNRDLLWELQQVKQQTQQPLRASSAGGSEELHRQVTTATLLLGLFASEVSHYFEPGPVHALIAI